MVTTSGHCTLRSQTMHHADERNGFNLRNTGHDTQAISMFTREQEVSKWVSDDRFITLEAA